MPTVSARIVSVLRHHVTEMFGVMGNGNAFLLDAVEKSPIEFTAMRHEAGGVVAADAYYRASGRIAAATATYGAGFTNTLTALAEAVRANTPLLLIVGAEPTTGPRPWDVDQTRVAAGLGAPTFTVSGEFAEATTVEAIEFALVNQTAVVLAIPYDLAGTEPEWPADESAARRAIRTGPPRVAPDDAELAAVATRLAGAARPVILAGRGAWLAGAGPALGELAERLGALTTSSALGLSIFPDRARDLGIAGGFGAARAMELVGQADVVLVVGAALNQFTTRFGDLFGRNSTVIQIDSATAATNPTVTRFVSSDALLAVEGILRHLNGAGDPLDPGAGVPTRTDPAAATIPTDTPPLRLSSGWAPLRAELTSGTPRARNHGEAATADGRLDPRALASALNHALPSNRTIVQDGGHFIGWAPSYLDVPSPNRLVMVGTAFQSIGLGLPSAVGAAAAQPDSTVVLCTGDGGALMALADLETVVRTVPSCVIVVFNDAAYGAEIHQYGSRGLELGPMLITEVDFAGLAAALGATGIVVRTLADLDALGVWLAAGASGVMVLDCRITRAVVAPYMHEIVAASRRAPHPQPQARRKPSYGRKIAILEP